MKQDREKMEERGEADLIDDQCCGDDWLLPRWLKLQRALEKGLTM